MSPGAAEMEDVKPSIPLLPDDGGAMEARFLDLCKNGLALDESMTRQATVLFRESKPILLANISAIGGGTPEEFERFWSASVLYCVARLGRVRTKEENGEGGIKLCQILRAAKLKVVDFFKEVPQFSLKVGHILRGLYGSDWEKRLEVKELQTNVVHLSLLSRYYKRIYEEFFLPRDMAICQHSTASGSMGYTSDHYQFGWLLFLTLRVHAFSRFKDLVTCTIGLISILALLIIHVPVRFRKFRIQDSPIFAKKSNKRINLLASLCCAYHTSEVELGRMMEKVNSLIVDILKKKPHPASECQVESLEYINTDGLMYFENLLEEKSLQSSLLILAKDYVDAINIKGELDERMFANDEDSLLGTGSLSGGAVNLSGTKRKLDAVTSPAKTMTGPLCPCSPSSPVNSKFAGNTKMASVTPVSTAMTTAKWLRDVVSPLPSKPSVELELFLSSCDKDMTSEVTCRANIILEVIFWNSSSFQDLCSQNTNLVDNIWAEQRRSESLKLYYRVLEAICRAESQMFSGNNLTSLLSNERFHRCMLACSAELVLATHKTVTMMFPSVLEKSGITSFDLSKVIESFVRHEETLPRELKRHLNSLEERLLESMAWEKGSSMYNSLIVAKPSLSTEINRLRLLAEPMISLDVIAKHHKISSGSFPPLHLQKSEPEKGRDGSAHSPNGICGKQTSVPIEHDSCTSPVKKHLVTFNSLKTRLPLLQSAFASPTRPNPVKGETCAETDITVFFNKIVKMAAIRIRSLCERLQLPQQVLECIYCLFQQILSQRTSLFFNRHIDQLILCSFYGVAKISRLSLTFKEIIYNYRKLPQCKPQVFRSVFVSWPSTGRKEKTGEEHVDIITFYNELFIPSVKPLLVELGTAGVTQKNQKLNEKNDSYGQIPGSPRLSPFPNLPDMSPKKVMASHNVYVSPMRQSKMGSLLSPSSKSYYACIGESTQAYQSPSKDLTAINDRLNCGSGRKINGRLNFDVVSDSVVAGSLGSLNSGSMCSDDAGPFKLPLKSEQPDT